MLSSRNSTTLFCSLLRTRSAVQASHHGKSRLPSVEIPQLYFKRIASALTVGDLTNLPIGNEGEVPHQPAIFFTLTTTGRILKIGSSPDLGEDWRTQLRAIAHCDLPEVRSVWLAVSDPALLPKLEQLFIDQFKPVLNGWDSKLSRIADLTIDGWYDFQKVDGRIWGFYGNGMMPLPVPSALPSAQQSCPLGNIKMPFGSRQVRSHG